MLLNFEQLIEKYDLDIKGVIHIGAHIGQELETYVKNSIPQVIFFEPQKDLFMELYKRVNETDLKGMKVNLYNFALGNEVGMTRMFVDTYNQGSASILKPELHVTQYPHIKFEKEAIVEIQKLDNLLKNDGTYNFWNMDVQGFELEVLKGGTEFLKNVDYVMSEVNRAEVYKDCAKIEQLDEFLGNFKFTRVETTWDGNTWGDAFYIKKNGID